MRDLIDKLLHRHIWSGDTIRLENHDGSLQGEHVVKVNGSCVRLVDGNPLTAIRSDLPRWSDQHGCWVYRYGY